MQSKRLYTLIMNTIHQFEQRDDVIRHRMNQRMFNEAVGEFKQDPTTDKICVACIMSKHLSEFHLKNDDRTYLGMCTTCILPPEPYRTDLSRRQYCHPMDPIKFLDTGLYILVDESDREVFVYVGCSVDISNRLRTHYLGLVTSTRTYTNKREIYRIAGFRLPDANPGSELNELERTLFNRLGDAIEQSWVSKISPYIARYTDTYTITISMGTAQRSYTISSWYR
jgi:hypothetical protein